MAKHEAQHRLRTYLSLLELNDVEYISVKISSIVSQINLVAFDQTLAAITNRLRTLYRTAMTHRYITYITPSGRRIAKFINLDYGNILLQPRHRKIDSRPERLAVCHVFACLFLGERDNPPHSAARAKTHNTPPCGTSTV